MEFYDSNGFRSSWISEGSGKKILFLPGWAESISAWKESCPKEDLANYQRIFINLGGHYPSEFPANREHLSLEEFLDSHFEVFNHIAANDKLILVGHSAGAFVLWHYCNRYPEKVDKIILVGSFMGGPLTGVASIIGLVKNWNLSFLTELGISYSQTSKSIFQDVLFSVDPNSRKEFLNREDVAKLLPFFFQEYKEMSPLSLRIVLEILEKARLSEMNLRDGLNLNFIHGDKDPISPFSSVKEFCSKYKTSRLFTIANTGHSPHWENKLLFWKCFKDILEE
jgi:pimeloyl-ACP methyl ester carboxylesterase